VLDWRAAASVCKSTAPLQLFAATTIGGSTVTDYTSPGIKYDQISTSGTYEITADGAQGGYSELGGAGGAGAVVSGDVYLQAGTELEIVVGGEGGTGSYGGGGGGSFVIEVNGATLADDTILAVAGGGGGGGDGIGGGGRIGATGGSGGGTDGGTGGIDGHAGKGGASGGGGGGFTGGAGSGSLRNQGSAGSVAGKTFDGGKGGGAGTGQGGAGGIGGGGGGGISGGGGGGGYGGGGGGGGGIDGGGSSDVLRPLASGGGSRDPVRPGGGGGSYLDTSVVTEVSEDAGTVYGDGSVTIAAVCYVAGTRLLTDRGEAAIENLAVGDRLVTASGKDRPVRWLGSRRVDCARHPEPSAVWPIRIQAGAFAPDVPKRALWVSPGHSIFVDGVLIQAEKLVNGATIVQVPLDRVEYWHVELDSHDVILADGLAAESYLDTGNRAGFFNNGSSYLEAHPNFRPNHWAETCMPLVMEGAALQKAREALRERALALGFTLTADPDVHVMVDGKRVDPVRLGAERLAFLLPEGGSNIELRSRTFIPAHVTRENPDTRSLGIDVVHLQIDGEVALDDETPFGCGWHALERDTEGRKHRWSRARVPLPAGTRLVVIDTWRQNSVYWQGCDASAAVAQVQRGSRAAAR
jgi:hypothetical protein